MAQSWAIVQKTSGTPVKSSPNAVAFGTNVTVGNRIIAIASHSYAGCPVSISDNLGNTYTKHGAGPLTVGPSVLYVWSAPVTTGGACTVTMTYACGSVRHSTIFEVSGLAASTPFDGEGGFENSANPCVTGAVTTTAADDMVLATFETTGIRTFSSPSGNLESTDTHGNISTSQDKATAGSVTPQATVDSFASSTVVAYAVAFKQIAGGSLTKLLTETVSFADSTARSTGRKLTESISLTDVITKFVSRKFLESATIADTFAGSKVTTKILTEIFTVADTLNRLTSHLLTETLTVTDTLFKRATKLLAETLTATDTLLKQAARSLAESLTVTDTFAANKVTVKLLTEAITVADTLARFTSRLLSETLTLTDTILKQTARRLTEIITVTDTLARLTTKLLAESVTVLDTLVVAFGGAISKVLTEIITVTDTLTRTVSRLFVEMVTFSDTLFHYLLPVFKSIVLSLLYPVSVILRLGSKTLTLKKDSTSANIKYPL